jgi:hypothetical protein
VRSWLQQPHVARVLERNGFELVAVRPVESEPNDNPMALYRLASTARGRPRRTANDD